MGLEGGVEVSGGLRLQPDLNLGMAIQLLKKMFLIDNYRWGIQSEFQMSWSRASTSLDQSQHFTDFQTKLSAIALSHWPTKTAWEM